MTGPGLPRVVRAGVCLLVFASTTRADVIVVDASGGGEYTSLIDALATAVDGDTLLVRPGDYREFGKTFQITGRSLVVAGDGTGPMLLSSPTTLLVVDDSL